MAKKVYDEEIKQSTDWGGDNSTGGLPVSGRRVQEYIKKSLNSLNNNLTNVSKNKYGYTRILDEKFLQQFADEKSAKQYDENPIENESLLLNTIQLPGTGETVAIMRVTVLTTPAEYTTNVQEIFRFRYLSYYNDETDLSPVRGEAVLRVNNREYQRMELRSGSTYEFDVTKYLTEEKNTIQVTVSNNEGSTRNFVYDVNIVKLSVSSTFDDTAAYKGNIQFRYTPIGDILKTVHFVLDGQEIGVEETTVNNRQLTYEIPAQTHGAHSLQVYITANITGNNIQSNTLYYDIICVEEGNMTPVITSTFISSSVRQYETVNIPFVVYDPAGSPATVQLFINDRKVSERNVDRTRQTWTYRANDKGELYMEIKCKEVIKSFIFDITESIVTSEAETRDLELYLTSQGRSNQDTNKEEWKYNNITASFSNMNWVTNGWVIDDNGSVCLRLSGGASVNIPFQIFSGDIRQSGKTVELEFTVSKVTNYNAIILSCFSNNIGLKLTSNTISLTSEQSEVKMQYKEDERIRVSFVIEKQADNRLMQIYVNGEKSQSFQYPNTDGFTQKNPVAISIGSSSATIDLYNIRVYSNNLNNSQILDNYIADIDDIDKKIAVFNRNQVYDSYGSLNLNSLNRQIPVMTIIGDLPNYKGDKKTVRIEYSDLQHPEKSFASNDCSLDVQGTSSQYYPRKNYKFKSKKGFEMTQGGHTDGFTLNEEECLPATVFCLKADFAESSGTHNTGIANYVGWLLREAGILTKPQNDNPLIRTTVYGEPCVIFHKKDENSIAEFIGKYNFNTDKGAENTFGFSTDDESWEFLNNTGERSLFRSADFEGDGWKDDFEARYPEDYTDVSKMSEVFTWVVSCKGNTEKFKEEFEQYFDKKQLIFYYVITLVFGMVDQRAKNMFLTNYKGGRWLFIFYDNDTCFGINNEGALAFSYNVEIHDKIGTQNVWNGEDSELWKLVEEAFADDIQEMYYNLRQQGILSYDKIIEYTNTRQSEKWCEAVYNEDGYYKYERPLIEGYEDWSSGSPVLTKTSAYLYALQGSRDAHRRWWLYNRFKYLDSKFQAGSSRSDFATFRTYTPTNWSGVKPNADITIKSFAAMYGTIKWGSVTRSERLGEGETKTIKAPDMQFNDTETIIYNASMIASLGNLSPLYVGSVDVSRMLNLTELIIGSNVSGYQNTNFTVLSVGTNHVLRKLDIRNCPNFTANIEVSACEAIEEIYAKGTSTTAVNLAEGGVLRILQLPATITNLTLKNQTHLTASGLQLEGTQNLVNIVIENTVGVDSYGLVKGCMTNGKLSRIRLIGIQATDSDLETLKAMSELKGIDDSGMQTEQAVITGTLHVESAYAEDLEILQKLFPNLDIIYDTLIQIPVRTIIVRGQDNSNTISGAIVLINGDEYTADENGQVSIQTSKALKIEVKAESYVTKIVNYDASIRDTRNTIYLDKLVTLNVLVKDQYDLPIRGVEVTFNNETKTTSSDGIAAFTTSRGSYNYSVKYKEETKEGSATIVQDDISISVSFTRAIEDYKPEPNGNIQMLVKRYNNYSFNLRIKSSTTDYVIDWGDGNTTPATGIGSVDYTHTYADDNFYNVEVKNCEDVTECAINLSSNNLYFLYAFWTIGNSKVNNLKFTLDSYSCRNLKIIGNDLFKNDTTRTSFYYCFYGCINLTEIPTGLFDNCPEVTSFSSCFYGCSKLSEIPTGLFDNCPEVTSFSSCFSGCVNLTEIPTGLFDNCTKVTSFSSCFYGCSKLSEIPTGLFDNCTKVTSFRNCFYDCRNITIPTGLFDNCTKVTDFSGCFSFCYNLPEIPTGLFDNCPEVTMFNNCFTSCQKITHIKFPTFEKITSTTYWQYAYSSCYKLAIIIVPQTVPQGISDNIFDNSGSHVTGGFKIYVPDEALDAYKTATNWRYYASKIYPMSELPE